MEITTLYKPSKYQEDIYNVYDNTRSNIIVNAGPGSGKSFTIQQLIKRTPKFLRVVLTAFNKSIADELKDKVPNWVKVSTMHSLGYSILREHFPRRYKVTEFKNFILCKNNLNINKSLPKKEQDIYIFNICDIINLCKLNLITERKDILMICEEYNKSILNNEIDDVITMFEVLDKYNVEDHKEFMIDFTDMLFLPVKYIKSNKFPKFNVVFVDELQDLNILQRSIIERLISPINGRLIGVGDKRQAIYGFMGSNLSSFEYFENRANTIIKPLSVSYRCAKNVVELANNIFEGLESYENNPVGVVRRGNLFDVEEGNFVLCRNNLPLIQAWLTIIKSGKKCSILGKDYGNALLVVLDKLSKYDDYKKGCEDVLLKKEDQLKESGVVNPKQTSNYQNLLEKINIINFLMKEFGGFERTKNKIEEIFTDDSTKDIILSTIHKSKGLESKKVYIIGYEQLLPSKYAKTISELYQERCLKYVAVTRAKEELVFVDI